MTDFPRVPVPPLFVSTYSMYSSMYEVAMTQGTMALTSQDWPANNNAIYIPITIPWPYMVNRVFWSNGTAAGGNTDFGIYSDGGIRIYSTGSTAGSGNSAPQYVTPGTPVLLVPGRYYFAMSHSITTANQTLCTSQPTIAAMRLAGILYEASALPLPASMTPAAVSGNRRVPLCGITQTTTGF